MELRSKYVIAAAMVASTVVWRYASGVIKKWRVQQIPFSTFLRDISAGRIAKVLLTPDYVYIWLRGASANQASYRTEIVKLFNHEQLFESLIKHDVEFASQLPLLRNAATILVALSPFVYLAVLWWYMQRLQGSGDSVGKRVNEAVNRRKVSFAEVAGVRHAKEELMEIVDFLKNRQKYERVGARIPKGILLSGPSGTGKTLLARAVASEAGVAFISCSASDFVEMLVGRGAARVRDLFSRGLSHSPCIIFIDELDALAKIRGGFGGGSDEREQTLNQLLTEMDGFDSSDNDVVVIAATNRPEVLDPALLRAGRFDRHIHVGLPDFEGRKDILGVHIQRVACEQYVDLDSLAVASNSFSGAELASVVNEAACSAVRRGSNLVNQSDLLLALKRVKQFRSLGMGMGMSVSMGTDVATKEDSQNDM